MLTRVVTCDTFHVRIFRVKLFADANILDILVTFDVFQLPMSPLPPLLNMLHGSAGTISNILLISRTFPTSQSPIFILKALSFRNIRLIVVTFDVSHELMSSLNDVAFSNKLDISVINVVTMFLKRTTLPPVVVK